MAQNRALLRVWGCCGAGGAWNVRKARNIGVSGGVDKGGRMWYNILIAGYAAVAKSADAADLKSASGQQSTGSSPVGGMAPAGKPAGVFF